jgi:hypothetical protein
MRRMKRRIPVKEPGWRPATSIEIDMINYAVNLPIPKAQANRRRFVDMLRLKEYAYRDGQQPSISVTDAQIRFLARTIWRYRKRLPPNIVLAAALKGGCEESRFAAQAREQIQRAKLRMQHVEDPLQFEIPWLKKESNDDRPFP